MPFCHTLLAFSVTQVNLRKHNDILVYFSLDDVVLGFGDIK